MANSYIFAFYLFDQYGTAEVSINDPAPVTTTTVSSPVVVEEEKKKRKFFFGKSPKVPKTETTTTTTTAVTSEIKKSKSNKQRKLHKELFEDHQQQVFKINKNCVFIFLSLKLWWKNCPSCWNCLWAKCSLMFCKIF